jgi:hypothetical protein
MFTGGCQCGALRYRALADPIRVYCCHCTECRAQSASAFGISVIVPVGAVALTRGQPRLWSRPTASGKVLECAFCPDCGSRVWHADTPRGDEMSIKGGSVDGGIDLTHAWHIWTASKLPGIVIPDGARQFPQEHD